MTKLPEPTEFTINVAMDIRAYGYVKVSETSLDEAISKCTPEFIRDNFEPNGSGSDDLDHSNPSGIYLNYATWWAEGDEPSESYIERDLPDDANVTHVTSLLHRDAEILVSVLDGIDLDTEGKRVRENLRAFVASKTA